jgi:NTP pyrophosphatase (non-canonical NTP hydrolase)
MDFSELQEKIIANAERYSKKHDILINDDYAIHKLYEEVGEFSQAWLIHNRQCRESKYVEKEMSKKMISHELADIIGIAVVIANLQKINLEKAIDQKWINREK